MPNTTRVSTSRLRDFEYYQSRIGSLVPSYQTTPPAGMLAIDVVNTEVAKAEWPELYETIGGSDGSSAAMFILPYKPNDGDLHYYLVGKVLISGTSLTGNIISTTFTNANLDANGYFTFNHGIDHTHPMIQLYDENGAQVLSDKIINTSGKSRVKVLGTFTPSISGTWTVQAIG